MLVRRVVDDELGEDAHVQSVRGVEEALEVVERAVHRIDRRVVRDVVPVVTQRRRVEGQEPDACHAEVAEVRQLLRESREITDAIVVAVVEAAHMRFVDDGVLVPMRVCHVFVGHPFRGACSQRGV